MLLISSEHEEMLGLAHRVLVMRGGQVVAEFDQETMSEEVRAARGVRTSGAPSRRPDGSRETSRRPTRSRPERAAGCRRLGRSATTASSSPSSALFITLSLTSHVFFTWANMKNLAFQTAPVGIIAAGGTLVFIAGGFDLSVGAVSGFAAIIAGKAFLQPASACGAR